MKKISILLVTMLILLTGCADEDPASIGIIGGADGPTAVFIAGSTNWLGIIIAVIAAAIIVSVSVYLIVRKK